jgi:hypothetical protein
MTHFIQNDRFPDVPMSTQGTNDWHDDSLEDQLPDDQCVATGMASLSVGATHGFQWQKARPTADGGFYDNKRGCGGHTPARVGG